MSTSLSLQKRIDVGNAQGEMQNPDFVFLIKQIASGSIKFSEHQHVQTTFSEKLPKGNFLSIVALGYLLGFIIGSYW